MLKHFCYMVLLFVNNIQAQEIFLKHFTIDDGLPSNEIYQVLQDEKGNLLAATDRGAARFDGYTFENLKLNKLQSSYPVYYIYKSPLGNIFFSGLKGYLYQYNENGLINYRYNDKIATLYKHPGLLIANTLSQHNDSLWISYNNDYNYNHNTGSCIVTQDGKVTKLVKDDGIYFDFPHNFFYRQLSNTGINQIVQPVFITWKDGSVTTDTIGLSWPSGYVRRLYVEEVSGYTIFCIGRQLLIYKGRRKVGSHLFDANIMSTTVINRTDLYLGFENAGATVYQIANGNISSPLHHYLSDLTVNSILQDHQKGVWFSTQENGLYYSYPSLPKYWETESKIISIQKNRDRIYVAQRDGIIQVFSKGKLVEQFKAPLKRDALHNIAFYNDSLVVLSNKKFYLRSGSTWNYFPATDIQILAGNAPAIYGAAAAYAEFYTFSELGGKPLKRTTLPKRVICMHHDKNNELWLGTWEGLFKYHNNKLTDLTNLNPVFKDRITSIKELGNKEIVISSLGNGLAVYKNGKSFLLNISNGLITPVINSMVVDGNFIWLGTNKGLTRVIFKDDKFDVQHFGTEAGLPTLDIHEFSIEKGQLYLKWINRLITISLNELENTNKPGSISITSVVVNDQQLPGLTEWNFKHDQNQFKFNFNSINLAAAKQQQFLYILEGFDSRWNNTSERFANYTNLPPGNYSFKVQAYIGMPMMAKDIAIYNFIIQPAYWEQWWFTGLILFAVLFFSFLIFRSRISAIKNKNRLLLNLAESQQKVLVQLINPHFIFNILNTVQGAILKKDKIIAASIISRFAKLMRLSMELSKQKLVTLEKELEFLHKYFELEGVRSPDKFSYRIEVQSSINPARIWVPSMLIQPFVENAIKHGVTHLSDKKGLIIIKFTYVNNQLLCYIDDNGVGRKQSQIINRNMETQYESSGIEITLNRLKLLHKEKKTEFVYHIEDKLDENKYSEGTTVIFSLPFVIEL